MDLRPLFDQGLAAHRAGRLEQAEAAYRQVLRADPGNFAGLHMLGFLKGQQGRFEEAIALLHKAVKRKPDDTAALGHYAYALMAATRTGEALEAYDRVLALAPDHFEALYNRGVILSQQQKFADSLEALDRALALKSNMAAVHFNRGVVLAGMERHREALESFDRALALDPAYTPAEANRAMAVLNLCDWERVAALPPAQAAQVAPPLTFLGYSDDKALQRTCAAARVRAIAPSPLTPLWNGERYRHDRLRIAYISADFREHAVAFQLAPLIERHDRTRFQAIGIATGFRDDSEIRARLTKGFERFHDFAGLTSEEIARRLREMEIDIAIDLGGHTGQSRLRIFAHRFAPVQASWLGYPGTSGAPFMDFLIADRIVAPSEHQPFFSERLVHLPDTFFPANLEKPQVTPTSRSDAGLPEGGFVFCCFNNSWKITQSIFDIWMRLLAAVPGSVLWLKQPAPDARDNLERHAQTRGIDPSRLVFAGDVPRGVHLARHALADLFLDTLPYNAHATAADALGAGLPVLTCLGEAFAGRVAASLLHAVGLEELVADNPADYERRLLELARKSAQLRTLREKLIRNLPTAPLFDTDRFARNLEAAYQRLHDEKGA